jgi:hypothetical protein
MEKENNCCLNAKKQFTKAQKLTLLKVVLDDDTFQQIKSNPRKIKEAFEVNMENILIASQGEF